MKTFASSTRDANSISSVGVFTLIVWAGCLLIGGLGFVLPYGRAHLEPQIRQVKPEMLDVQLAEDAQLETESPNPITQPNAFPQPQVPPPIPVAQPSPVIAFTLPVQGPVRVVETSEAAYAQSSSTATTAGAPTPRRLTFGQGEGRQPKPEYPVRAQRDGQEGVVVVLFTVAKDGHVVAAEAKSPSRWPLLNESALRTVKERWQFSPGELRVYIVPIRFELPR